MRFLALAIVLLTGCAAQPARQSTTSATRPTMLVASASQPVPSASSETIQQREAIKTALQTGYKARVEHGKTQYCRDETPIGTHFRSVRCFTIDQLTEEKERQSLPDLLAQPAVCSFGAFCVGGK